MIEFPKMKLKLYHCHGNSHQRRVQRRKAKRLDFEITLTAQPRKQK